MYSVNMGGIIGRVTCKTLAEARRAFRDYIGSTSNFERWAVGVYGSIEEAYNRNIIEIKTGEN